MNIETQRADMRRTADQYTELWHIPDPGLAPEQLHAQFEKDRADLFDERSLEGFAKARSWFAERRRTKHINPGAGSSYGMKHVAGHAIGYTTNGVFIAAAVAEGDAIKRCSHTSPNAWFNIAKRRRGDRWDAVGYQGAGHHDDQL
jgi:hypothetical protein